MLFLLQYDNVSLIWCHCDVIQHRIEKTKGVLYSSHHALSYDMLLNMVSWKNNFKVSFDLGRQQWRSRSPSEGTRVLQDLAYCCEVSRTSIKKNCGQYNVLLISTFGVTMTNFSPKWNQLQLLLVSTITQNLKVISWKLNARLLTNRQTNQQRWEHSLSLWGKMKQLLSDGHEDPLHLNVL